MNIKQNLKKWKKRVVTLGVALIASSAIAPSVVSAHDAYFLSITVDPSSQQFVGIVSEDKNDINANNHAEIKNTGAYFGAYSGGKSYVANSASKDGISPLSLPSTTAAIDSDSLTEKFSSFVPESKHKDDVLIFSFPGVHVDSVSDTFTGDKRDANGLDRQQAQWVSKNLVGGLNQAIAYVHSHSYSDVDNPRGRTINTGRALANAGAKVAGVNNNGSGATTTFSVNGKTYDVADGRDVPDKDPDIFKTYYIKLRLSPDSGGDGKWQYFPWAVPKGYGKDHRLYNVIKDTDYFEHAKKDARFLSWQHVAMQGIYNAAVSGYEFSSADQLNPPNWIEMAIAGVLSSIIGIIESLLGLHSLPELMLNRGQYGATAWEGVMPLGLADVADYVHLFVQFIAWLLLAGSIAKLLTMRNLSAINSKMRVELKEGAMNILGAGAALLMFIPIFRSMLAINSGLVQFFGGISDKADLFGAAQMTNGGYIAPILVSLVMLGITIYMNITYIMRGITIAVLYAFAPLFIISIAYGGQMKQLFSTFIKELFGLIFMQTIHAVMISIYTLAFFNGATTGMLYTMVLSASFIPITKLIRNDIMGMKEGIGGTFGSTAVGAAGGLALSGMSMMKTNHDINKMNAGSSNSSTNFSRKATTNGGGGGGGGGSTANVQTMLDNDSMGSTPSHYAGGGDSFNAQMKSPDQLKPTAKERVGAGAKAVGGAALKGAKVASGASAMLAATTLEASTGSNGISQGVGHLIQQGNQTKRIMAMGGRGGGGMADTAGNSTIPMPSHDVLKQYETQQGQLGFVVSGSKDNGDIVNIHETKSMQESAGISNMMDNGEHLLATAQFNEKNSDVLNQMMDDFGSGNAEAMAHWQGQGIDFAKKTADGEVMLGFNKQTLGVNSFEQDNQYSKFDIKPTANQRFFDVNSMKQRPALTSSDSDSGTKVAEA